MFSICKWHHPEGTEILQEVTSRSHGIKMNWESKGITGDPINTKTIVIMIKLKK